MALRDSVSVADVRLERKTCYEYAKLKSKCKLRSRPVQYVPVSQLKSAEATSVSTRSRQYLSVRSSIPTNIGSKRQGSKPDPGRDVHKLQRRTGNLAERVSRTPMSSTTQGTHTTLPITGFDHDDDAFERGFSTWNWRFPCSSSNAGVGRCRGKCARRFGSRSEPSP